MRGRIPGLASPVPLASRLPAVLQEDEFLQRFLASFDESLAPVFLALDGLASYVDPRLAPEDFLNWLSEWVGVRVDEHWPVAQRREIVANGARIHRRRGTAAGCIHGFTRDMLVGKPKFAEILPSLLEFLGDDPVIAHNAVFDFNFLDHEFKRANQPPIPRARMGETRVMAKKRFPGLPNSLDALCRRYGIDNSMRTSHNALLDVQLLAQVYLELMGGKQPGLELAGNRAAASNAPVLLDAAPVVRTPRPITPSADELDAHAAFLGKLKEPIWRALD